MGYDQHQQRNSSGTLVAVVGVGLVLAILVIIAAAGVGLFWVRSETQQAIVMEHRAVAETHFDDGTFSACDKLSLKVVTPERHAGTTFSVTVPPTEIPEDSAFRTAGTRFTFMMLESNIGATRLAWGAIDDPTIGQ